MIWNSKSHHCRNRSKIINRILSELVNLVARTPHQLRYLQLGQHYGYLTRGQQSARRLLFYNTVLTNQKV
jgi:hypothetical protein